MPDLDKLVAKLRAELAAEKEESKRRHEELVEALRDAGEIEEPSPTERMRRAYADSDPAAIREERQERRRG